MALSADISLNLLSGDIVSFSEEKYGFLTAPDLYQEPIPEISEKISHLRTTSLFSSGCGLWDQGMFRILLSGSRETSNGNEIQFGSIVQLIHEPTKFIVSATNINLETWQEVNISSPHRRLDSCVYLGKSAWNEDEVATKWQIWSRFKTRHEGEPVRSDDYVVLKNLRYKELILCPYGRIVDISDTSPLSNIVVGHTCVQEQVYQPWFWRIQLLRRPCDVNSKALQFGDYVKICGVDSPRKQLIGRLDDETESKSKVSPCGLCCIKLMESATNQYFFDIFIRNSPEDSMSSESFAQAIWQILPCEDDSFPLTEVKMNTPLMIRHVLSGKLLSFTKPSAVSVRSSEIHGVLTNEISTECLFYMRSVDVDVNAENVTAKFTDDIYFEHKDTATLIIIDDNILNVEKLYAQKKRPKAMARDKTARIRQREKFFETVEQNVTQLDQVDGSWWENIFDTPLVCDNVDLDSSAVYAAICQLTVISSVDAMEVLYVHRLLQVAIVAMKKLHSNFIGVTDLPIFRHFFNSIVALSRWVTCEINDDAFVPISTIFSRLKIGRSEGWEEKSSLANWLFAGEQLMSINQSSLSALPNKTTKPLPVFKYDKDYFIKKLKHVDFNASAKHVVQRKKILMDSRMIDMLLYFAQSVYLTHVAHEQNDDDDAGDTLIHPLLIDCCVAIQDLIRVCVTENPLLSSRIMTLTDCFVNLIHQKIAGQWDPPIQTILESVEPLLQIAPSKLSLQQSRVVQLVNDCVSLNDIRTIVSAMHKLRSEGDPRAFQIISVLTMLSYPGKYPNRRFQEQILWSIAQPEYVNPKYLEKRSAEAYECPPNPLLKTAYHRGSSDEYDLIDDDETHPLEPSKDDRYRSRRLTRKVGWEVTVNPSYELDVLADENESLDAMIASLRSSLDQKTQDELIYLAQFFLLSTKDRQSFSSGPHGNFPLGFSNGRLNRPSARNFLVAQGFALKYLMAELDIIEGFSFWQLWRWWYVRRLFYFPSEVVVPSFNDCKDFLFDRFHDYFGASDDATIIQDSNAISYSLFPQQLGSDGSASWIQNPSARKSEKLLAHRSISTTIHGRDNSPLMSLVPFANDSSPSDSPYDGLSPRMRIHTEMKSLYFNRSLQETSPTNQYMPWTDAIVENKHKSEYDFLWLVESLNMIIALCRGRHFYAQLFGSSVLPIDCLVGLLSDKDYPFTIKRLLFEYLNHIYLENDFVYNLSFKSTINGVVSPSAIVSSNPQSYLTMNQFFSSGMVFNARSRYKFHGSTPEDELCRQLWVIMIKGLFNFSFAYVPDYVGFRLYARSFLQTIKLLTENDFFSEKFIKFLFRNEEESTVSDGSTKPKRSMRDYGLEKVFFYTEDRRFDDGDVQRWLLSMLLLFFNNIVAEAPNYIRKPIDNRSGNTEQKTESPTIMSRICGCIPSALTQAITQSGDDEISDDDMKKFYETMFRDENIAAMITEIMTILWTIQNQQFSNYIRHMMSQVLTVKKNKTISLTYKDISSGPVVKNLLLKNKKCQRIVMKYPLLDPVYLENINVAMVNCFLMRDCHILHRYLVDFMYSLTMIDGGLQELVNKSIIKVHVVDTPKLTKNEHSETQAVALNGGNVIKVRSKIDMSDCQCLIIALSDILIKFAADYSAGLIISRSSNNTLRCRADTLKFCVDRFLSALNMISVDTENSAMDIYSDGARQQLNLRRSSMIMLSRAADKRSSFGIELIDVTDNPHRVSQQMPQYSLEYELEFIRNHKKFPIRLAAYILDDLYRSIRILDRSMRIALKNPLKKSSFQEVFNENMKNHDEKTANLFELATDFLKSSDIYNDEAFLKKSLTFKTDKIREEALIDMNDIAFGQQEFLINPAATKLQFQALTQLTGPMVVFESVCELLSVLGSYSDAVSAQHFDRMKAAIYLYLENYLTIEYLRNSFICRFDRVVDALTVYSKFVSFDSQFEYLLVNVTELTLKRMIYRFRYLVETNELLTARLDSMIFKLEVSVIRLATSMIVSYPHDFDTGQKIESPRKTYWKLISLLEETLPDIYNHVMKHWTIVLSSNLDQETNLMYSCLFEALFKLLITCLRSDMKAINHDSKYQLSLIVDESLADQVLQLPSNKCVLPIKSHVTLTAMIYFDTSAFAVEKMILWELDTIVLHLSSPGQLPDQRLVDSVKPNRFLELTNANSDSLNSLRGRRLFLGPPMHCVLSCRQYIVDGVIPALLWRIMTSKSYSAKKITQTMMDIIRARIKVSLTTKKATPILADENTISLSLENYLLMKETQVWHSRPKDASHAHLESFPAEFYSCVRVLFRLVLEHRRRFRLFDCEDMIVPDIDDVVLDLSHLLIGTKILLFAASSGLADRLWGELKPLEDSVLIDSLISVLASANCAYGRGRLSELSLVRVVVVDKLPKKSKRVNAISTENVPNMTSQRMNSMFSPETAMNFEDGLIYDDVDDDGVEIDSEDSDGADEYDEEASGPMKILGKQFSKRPAGKKQKKVEFDHSAKVSSSRRFTIHRTASEIVRYKPAKVLDDDEESVEGPGNTLVEIHGPITGGTYEDTQVAIVTALNRIDKKASQSSLVKQSSTHTSKKTFSDYLEKSTLYRVLMEKLLIAVRFQINKMKASTTKDFFKAKVSSYDDWSEGGARIIKNLIEFLSQQADDKNFSTSAFMEIFIRFLDDQVDEIRANTNQTIQQKIERVKIEVNRVNDIQNLLTSCEIAKLIMDKIINRESFRKDIADTANEKILGVTEIANERALESSTEEASSHSGLELMAFKLATAVTAWGNHLTQDALMASMVTLPIDIPLSKRVVSVKKRVFIGAAATLELVSSLQHHVEAVSDLVTDGETIIRMLPLIEEIFRFCSSLCSGFYEKGRLFLLGKSDVRSTQNVNILSALVELIVTLIDAINQLIHYIDNPIFQSQLAPFVWTSRSNNRRDYVNWHHPKNNFPLLLKLIQSVTVGFDFLVRVNGKQSQDVIAPVVAQCPKLLKFLGLQNLHAKMPSQAVGVFGSLLKGNLVEWPGGDVFKFYETYYVELKAKGALDSEDFLPDKTVIQKLAQEGIKMNKSKRSAFLKEFLQISFEELTKSCIDCELNVQRFLLALNENSDSIQLKHSMIKSFEIEILMQNLDSYYQQARKNELFSTLAVNYITLISDIACVDDEISLLLDDWQSKQYSGPLHKATVVSIEINGPNGALQRVYFPTPTFIRRLWGYPEVQKAKEEILLTVNRNSPEEKMSDFQDQIFALELVMNRQNYLRKFLGPLHQFIGGKTLVGSSTIGKLLVPSQRVIFNIITVFFNVYYVYVESTTPAYQFPSSPVTEIDEIRKAIVEYFMPVLRYVHLALSGLLIIRTVLNSRAADNIKAPIYSSNSSQEAGDNPGESDGADNLSGASKPYLLRNPVTAGPIYILDRFLLLVIIVVVLLYDAVWQIFMTAMSYLGFSYSVWFYALNLLDLIYLFDLFKFLVVALQRNIIRIGFTILMAILLLYFYAILNYLFVQDQYSLNSHSGCSTILACLKLHIDYGLNSSPSWNNDGFIQSEVVTISGVHLFGTSQLAVAAERVLGTIFNISYIVVINLVLQAVISGLIIDTFSTMRGEVEDIQEDIRSTCFICSISRDEFEKYGISFRRHVQQEHNMWKYMWYKVYLDSKDPLNYSTTENHIAEAYKSDLTFIKLAPINKSISLNQMKNRDEKG